LRLRRCVSSAGTRPKETGSGLEKNDFIPQVQDIITVGEFYEMAPGGQIIFT